MLTAGKREDYIKPMAGGSVSWRSIQISETGSEATSDAWQQGGYELTTRRCAMISRVNRGEMEIVDYPRYHGLEPVDTFLNRVDREMTRGSNDLLSKYQPHGNSSKMVKNALQYTKRLGKRQTSHEGKIFTG